MIGAAINTTRQRLGADFPGITETPLRPRTSRAQALLAPVLLIAAMVVGVLLSFQSNDLTGRLQLAGLGLALGAFGAAMLVWEASVSVGVVRFDNRSPSLRFSYAPGLDLMYPLAAALVTLPAAVPLVALLRGAAAAEIGYGRRTALGLGLLGLVFLAQQLWALRVPRGLQLTPEGLRGVRGVGRLALTWDDLGAASAVSTRSGAKLCLHVTGGGAHLLPRRLLGSDPDAVAAIINHYLRHPADRGHLSDPEVAIRRVARSGDC